MHGRRTSACRLPLCSAIGYVLIVLIIPARAQTSAEDPQRLPPVPSPENSSSTVSSTDGVDLVGFEVVYFEKTPHEYGPSGYVRRPYDTGPELPVYLGERSPARASHYVLTHGEQGSKTKISWAGRVHLDGVFDFDPIGSNAEFVTAAIPVPQQRGGNSDFTARSSRLEFKTQTESRVGLITSFAQLDFFDRDTQGPNGKFLPRLRFFYADVGWFRFGQDASVFMDYGAYPNVIENEGPAAIILIRQSLARCTIPLQDRLNLAIAVEQPYSDISLPTDDSGLAIGRRIQDLPDLTSHLNYHNDYGHLQLAGVVRRITYQSPSQTDARATGYGVNFTGDLHLWALLSGEPTSGTDCASADAKSRFVWQYAAGYGVGRYVEDTTGLGLDAALDSNGGLDALFARGWYAGYEHWWTQRLTSTFVFSDNATSSTDTLAGDTYAGASYVATNLIWHFADKAWVGIEFLWGERRNLNEERAQANRLQLAARYLF